MPIEELLQILTEPGQILPHSTLVKEEAAGVEPFEPHGESTPR